MAWIGGAAAAAAAAAACNNTGKRRKKPSKLLLVITLLSLVIGIFIPLVIILGMHSSSSMTLFPLILVFIFLIGILVLVTASISEPLDYYDESEIKDDAYYRRSRTPYRANQKPQNIPYHKHEPREDYYWDAEPTSTSFFCINCGARLESDDRFCASCGRRVN